MRIRALTARERDGTAPGANKRGPESPIWTARKNEWIGLMDVAGLELEALYGGFASEPFNDDSREYAFVARR